MIPVQSEVERDKPTFYKLLSLFWHLSLLDTGQKAENSV